MKKIYLLIFLGLLLISFVSAEKEICIDFDAPSEPTNLEVTSSGTDIILTWDAATDVPDCSGIDSYDVYVDGDLIGTTSSDTLTFSYEDVPYGTYSFSVNALDKVSYNSGDAIKNDVVLSAPTDETDSSDTGDSSSDTTVSGGSGRSSYVCYEEWECDEWNACVNEIQTRTCTDSNSCGTTKDKPTISKSCGVEEDNEIELTNFDDSPNVLSRITGAITETLGTGGTISVSVLILGVIGAFVFVKIRKRRIN